TLSASGARANARLAPPLAACFPAAGRARYAEEFEGFLGAHPPGFRAVFNVVGWAMTNAFLLPVNSTWTNVNAHLSSPLSGRPPRRKCLRLPGSPQNLCASTTKWIRSDSWSSSQSNRRSEERRVGKEGN